jgi:uncharacterized membrane protein
MKFIFGIIGAYLGALIDSFNGIFFGAAIGVLFAYIFELKKHLRTIQEELSNIQSNMVDSNMMVDQTVSEGIQVDEVDMDVEEISITEEVVDSEEVTQINHSAKLPGSNVEIESTLSSEWNDSSAGDSEQVYPIDKFINYIKQFFTAGNVVVKVGIIILFFGVAFLLKYAAQKNAFPIELRLISVAAGAIVMLIFGWRLRYSKKSYALALQGGAVGILYLTVFTAAKLYTVLPLGLTFFLMIALVIFSCLLAVIQDSRSLACLATVGGFLAPILTSSGGGSHIALFSYYAVLNAGIFGIAWFKAWRILNWLGFVFTFVIASLWGHDSYRAEYFDTTEPFLILFFLFYVGVSILFAHKQPPHLKGLVDGSLVFGVPLVGFTLQGLLVKDYEFGLAISALSMSALYVLLARWLWNKNIEGMRLLTESFVALAVIFASLAIPFALDGDWTAVAWALEGAGICWVGIRQKRLLPRLFGLLLQFGSGIILLDTIQSAYYSIPILNSTYMGSLLLSISGLFSAYFFYKYKTQLKQGEQAIHYIMLVWALLWWFYSGINEIDIHVASRYEINTALFFTALSFLSISLIARTLEWRTAEFPPVLLLPAMYFITLIRFIDAPSRNFLSDYGVVSWVAVFLIQLLLLYRCENYWSKKLLAFWHSLTMYLYVFICTLVIADFIDYFLPDYRVWEDIAWGLIPAIGVMKMMYLRDRVSWPIMEFPKSYVGKGLFPIVLYLSAWIVLSCFNAGNPRPLLPYIPIVNPLELVQLLCIIIILNWWVLIKREEIPKISFLNQSLALNAIGVISFIYITSVVAHAVHFYAGVRFDESAMLRSEVFQTSISIVWTLTAFSVMWMATRRQFRKLWYVGAALLGVVVVKLFLIDLADSGAVTRIISFMTVGILMLVIGYISPIPPKETVGTQ